MTVAAMIIQLSTREIVDSNNWFLRLSDKTVPRHYHSLNYDWTSLSQNSCQNAMILPAHRSRIRINFGSESQQIGEKVFAKARRFQLTNCNFILREVKFLANDLIARRGRVSDRVILLLRSTKRQPRNRLDFFQREHSALSHRWYCRYKRDIEGRKRTENRKRRTENRRKRAESREEKEQRTGGEESRESEEKRAENRKKEGQRAAKERAGRESGEEAWAAVWETREESVSESSRSKIFCQRRRSSQIRERGPSKNDLSETWWF